MEIGLYNAKYPFRKLIHFLLWFCKNLDPNHLSLALIPIGFITAFIYYFANSVPTLYWFGIGLIFLRMIIGTLDGLVAENFNKQTANGAIMNRLTPEIADMMFMLAIILSKPPEYWLLGLFALTISWGICFAGLVGLAGGKQIQSVGPVGQTDRIIALILISGLQYFSLSGDWDFDFMKLFLWWVILGGSATIALRFYRLLIK